MKFNNVFLICLGFLLTLKGQAQFSYNDTLQNKSEITTIEFEEPVYNFGEVNQGEKVSHVYVFRNTGDKPLTIIAAKGSCGCTVPFFPKVPIKPGGKSEIEVEFDTKGKYGMQHKKVTLVANTSPISNIIAIKGNVLSTENEQPYLESNDDTLKIEHERQVKEFNPNCMAIYPNPANEVLQLKLREYIGQLAHVQISNDKGQTIMTKTIERISHESTRFDVSTFSSGIYTISVQIGNSVPITQCFVITNN